jgi:hypothetical protein
MIATRRQGLALAMLVTFGLLAWMAARDGSGRHAPEQARAARQNALAAALPSSAHQAAALAADRPSAGPGLTRDPLTDTATDPFGVVSFLPPQPKVVVLPPPPPPPEKPTAPPFPYRYFGRIVDLNGNAVTYLTRNDELIPIRVQDVLDSVYRIDSISATQIVATYLPLDEKVALSTESAAH